MPTIALLNQSGEKIRDLELNASIFGIEEINQQVIYDVVNCQRAAMRQGTHDVKNRSEVRGGGRKPWSAFAGGTMLYVISDEMIPETHAHGHQRGATYALLVGFCVMLVTDLLLG